MEQVKEENEKIYCEWQNMKTGCIMYYYFDNIKDMYKKMETLEKIKLLKIERVIKLKD